MYTWPSASPHIAWRGLRPPGTPNPLIKDYVANGIFVQSQAGLSRYLPKQMGGKGPMHGNGGCGGTPVRLAAVAEPAQTIGIGDGLDFELWTLAQTDAWPEDRCDRRSCCVGVYGAAFRCSLYVAKRHNGGFSATYLDGHAKWVRQSKPGEWTIQADPLEQ